MFAKAVIQVWLGAALTSRVPEARVWGGSRQSPILLADGDPPGRRLVLFECVGSVPMQRVARSSRINKHQVLSYLQDELLLPWIDRVFFVLGHPSDAERPPSLEHAADYLRCMALADVAAHIDRTGRGTINSDLLELLGLTPSVSNPHAAALTFDETLNVASHSLPVTPPLVADGLARSPATSRGLEWMARPMPVCVELPA